MSDEHNTPGWTEYVKDAHSEARDAFKLWILSSKPRHGEVFQSMNKARARFKFKLRPCTRDEARIRADILADDLVMRNTTLFWSHVSKQNRRCIIPADTLVEPLVVKPLLPCGKITMRICSIVWIPYQTKNLF